jgi:hypothetical protein
LRNVIILICCALRTKMRPLVVTAAQAQEAASRRSGSTTTHLSAFLLALPITKLVVRRNFFDWVRAVGFDEVTGVVVEIFRFGGAGRDGVNSEVEK